MTNCQRRQPWVTAACNACGKPFTADTWARRITDVNGDTSHEHCCRASIRRPARRRRKLVKAETFMEFSQ